MRIDLALSQKLFHYLLLQSHFSFNLIEHSHLSVEICLGGLCILVLNLIVTSNAIVGGVLLRVAVKRLLWAYLTCSRCPSSNHSYWDLLLLLLNRRLLCYNCLRGKLLRERLGNHEGHACLLGLHFICVLEVISIVGFKIYGRRQIYLAYKSYFYFNYKL
jgi:hypothetical protein